MSRILPQAAPLTSVLRLCSLAAILAACNSAQADWTRTSSENTIAAYQNFLASHPNDEHASEAQALILQLKDDAGWREAQNSGTSAAYERYLQQFPRGTHAATAHDAMTSIDRATAWKTAQGEGTAAALEAFLQKYPTGPEAQQAKDRLEELTGYRAHVTNEPTAARARRKLSELSARLKGHASGFAVTPDASGTSFSIDSPGMTQQEAAGVCAAVKQTHQPCHVVEQ